MQVMAGLAINLYGENEQLSVEVDLYEEGSRLAIQLIVHDPDGFSEPYGTLTVNLPDEHLEDGEVFVKDWSENEPLVPWAQAQKILGEPTGRTVRSGYVQVPVYRLHPKFVALLVQKMFDKNHPECERWLQRTAATVAEHKARLLHDLKDNQEK